MFSLCFLWFENELVFVLILLNKVFTVSLFLSSLLMCQDFQVFIIYGRLLSFRFMHKSGSDDELKEGMINERCKH
jgi:hypothetical protein